MPVQNKNQNKNQKISYTQKQFEHDLNQLENLISKNQQGGSHNNNNDNDNNNNNNNNDDDEDSEDEDEEQNGGAKDYKGTFRHFKVYELNGKKVTFDNTVSIKEHHTPLNAAKKLLRSICLHQNLKGMKKLDVHAVYTIRETTRGAKTHDKIYGPYKGKYVKYTPEEVKKATASGVSFKMKPVVKLDKSKVGNVAHKGGVHPPKR